MAGRKRRDGTAARAPRKCRLTKRYVTAKAREVGPHWDTDQKGLILFVQPSGHRSYKVVYRHHGNTRWYHLESVNAITLDDARREAAKVMLRVMQGEDPQAEKRANRSVGTFGELALRYVNEYAKKKNKSWPQARALIERNVMPRWGKLQSAQITRDDVERMMGAITSPTTANQTLAATSAIFSWAIKKGIDGVKVNPCAKIERNETHDRERVLSDSELPVFWNAFDDAGLRASSALKTLLLSGQRPGEVAHMRWEHIKDGWWEMPGRPVIKDGKVIWPGTKNAADHRIWLPTPIQSLLRELEDEGTEYVFGGERDRSVKVLAIAMRRLCTDLDIDPKVTPHDLRRTHGTKITQLGFGRDAMNRIMNHREGGIASVYDRHAYADENKRIMEAVATYILNLVTGKSAKGAKVVPLRR